MIPPSVSVLIVVALTALPAVTNAQACAAGSGTGVAQELKGNWYCSEVKAITYSNFPGRGYYNKVTNMDASTGQCSSAKYSYSGSLSPLNEELSLHLRGPLSLKQLAVYAPSSASAPTKAKRSFHDHGYGHARHGQRGLPGHHWIHGNRDNPKQVLEPDLHPRAVGDIVSATIDGKLVAWTNEYAGPSAATPATVNDGSANVAPPENVKVAYQASPSNIASAASTLSASANGASQAASSSDESSNPASGTSSGTGSWARQAYYNAGAATAQGITFLNHFGGVGGIPGTAGGSAFGASLSYASSDGQSGAASRQTLANAMIEDDTEVIILSDKSCGDGGCGYTRPGGVAYHGFSGSQKLFVLEFEMPFTGKTSFNGDMPAIWLHNAQIPLTSQYGTNPECSCWTSGCGEFDLFEILDSGDFRCKSTLHMAPAGGSSDWFLRPTNGSITAVVAFTGDNEQATIRILDEGASFANALSGDVVNGWTSGKSSVFTMGS